LLPWASRAWKTHERSIQHVVDMRDMEEIECDTERRDARQRVGGQTNMAGAQVEMGSSSTTNDDGDSSSGYRRTSMKRIEANKK
jgi:hypothetical protein